MKFIQYINMAPGIIGAIGTTVIYFNSYSMQPLEGGVFGGPELSAYNDDIKRKNTKRLIFQRIGLAFLFASFVFQAAITAV